LASQSAIQTDLTLTKDRLLAFLDILGFSESVRVGGAQPEVKIRKLETFAVGVAGKHSSSSLKVAAISDSAMIMTDTADVQLFIEALLEVVQQCFASDVMLRGGVAQGAISESAFQYTLPNYKGMQVWGSPVVEAARLEKRLKGGRIALSDLAARSIGAVAPQLVVDGLQGGPAELRWSAPQYDDDYLWKLEGDAMTAYAADPGECVHYLETMKLILRSTNSVKALEFGLIAFVDAPHPPPGTADLWVVSMDRARDLSGKHPELLDAMNNERTALARLISPASQGLQAALQGATAETRRTFNAVAIDAWHRYMASILKP
jgi:hypothetical protein